MDVKHWYLKEWGKNNGGQTERKQRKSEGEHQRQMHTNDSIWGWVGLGMKEGEEMEEKGWWLCPWKVYIQWLQTYQASQGVGWGEKFLLKINIKVQSSQVGGGKEEKDRKGGRHKKKWWEGLFFCQLTEWWRQVVRQAIGSALMGVVGRYLWTWLHCRLAGRNRWFKQETFRSERAQETWEGSLLLRLQITFTWRFSKTTLHLMEWENRDVH